MRVVTEHDLPRRCAGGPVFLHHDPCGPAAAFYWAAAALERPPDDRAVRDVECVWSARVHERLPAVNAFELPGGRSRDDDRRRCDG